MGLYIDFDNFLAEAVECLEGGEPFLIPIKAPYGLVVDLCFSQKQLVLVGKEVIVQMSLDRKKRRIERWSGFSSCRTQVFRKC